MTILPSRLAFLEFDGARLGPLMARIVVFGMPQMARRNAALEAPATALGAFHRRLAKGRQVVARILLLFGLFATWFG